VLRASTDFGDCHGDGRWYGEPCFGLPNAIKLRKQRRSLSRRMVHPIRRRRSESLSRKHHSMSRRSEAKPRLVYFIQPGDTLVDSVVRRRVRDACLDSRLPSGRTLVLFVSIIPFWQTQQLRGLDLVGGNEGRARDLWALPLRPFLVTHLFVGGAFPVRPGYRRGFAPTTRHPGRRQTR
jgi:hypothetical protein